MENTQEITSIQPQKTNPPVDDRSLEEIAKLREQEIAKKQARFKIVYLVIKIILLVLFLFAAKSYWDYRRLKVVARPFELNNNKNSTVEEEPNSTDTRTWTSYRSEKVQVFVKHPIDSVMIEVEKPALKLLSIFDRNNKFPTAVTENSLSEGYIFRVTPLNIEARKLDDIAKIKVESFKVKCPETATFSEIKTDIVDLEEARTFEILNCNGDYIVSYVPKFGIYYEIAQIYKGDFGYKQKYRAILEEMMRAFKFFPEGVIQEGPYTTFIDDLNKIMFRHPNLDATCCQILPPPLENIATIAVFGDKSTYTDKNNFDGVGIFMVDSVYFRAGFEETLEAQKRILKEDYKVVTGEDPKTSDEIIKVGKYQATKLTGYSWQGFDLIYMEVGGERGPRLIVFIVQNMTGEAFENKVMDILDSFESFAVQK